jgi:hypothetical protein
MASPISAARSALYTLLVAATATGQPLENVQVVWGDPMAYEEQEVVSLAGATGATVQRSGMGGGRDDNYDIVVRWKAHNPAGDAQTVDGRGWDLAEAIETIVDNNRTLSNTVLTAAAVSESENGAQSAEGGGWVIFGTTIVACGSLT